jgi:O-antigen/teichoic acid export membrane protein
MTNRRRLGDLLFVGVASATGGLFSYSFHILSGRILGPASYSDLAIIFGLITVITTVGTAFQASVARNVSSSQTFRASGFLDPYSIHVARVGAGVLVVTVLISPLLAISLELQARLFLPVAFFVFAAFGESIATGRLQGLRRFRLMSLFSVAQSVAKVCSVGIAALFGWKAFGMAAAIVVLATLITAAELVSSRDAPAIREERLDTVTKRHLVALVVFWMIQAADAQVARFGLGDQLAGSYSATAQLGKVALIIPLMIIQLAFPDLADSDERRAHIAYMRAALEILIACSLVFLILLVTHKEIVDFLLGSEYLNQSKIVWQVAAICVPYAMANLELSYAVARGALRRPIHMLVVLGVFFIVGYTWCTTPLRLIVLNLVAGLGLFIGLRLRRTDSPSLTVSAAEF